LDGEGPLYEGPRSDDAAGWVKEAGALGQGEAAGEEGRCLRDECGVKTNLTGSTSVARNESAAVRIYRRAAEQGQASAQFNLGVLTAEWHRGGEERAGSSAFLPIGGRAGGRGRAVCLAKGVGSARNDWRRSCSSRRRPSRATPTRSTTWGMPGERHRAREGRGRDGPLLQIGCRARRGVSALIELM
jgi:TPR repeat protein